MKWQVSLTDSVNGSVRWFGLQASKCAFIPPFQVGNWGLENLRTLTTSQLEHKRTLEKADVRAAQPNYWLFLVVVVFGSGFETGSPCHPVSLELVL